MHIDPYSIITFRGLLVSTGKYCSTRGLMALEISSSEG